MKTLTNYIKTLMLLLVLASAKTGLAQCTAGIVSVSNGSGNYSFNATATGTNGTSSYFWAFGDGGTSSGAGVNHTYASNGLVLVTLTVVTSAPSCSTVAIDTLVINTLPTPCNLAANFTYSLGSNGQVFFYNTSTGTTGGSSYSWSFGDATNGTGASTSHIYSSTGNYVVSLTVSNSASCTSTYTQSINVNNICPVYASYTLTPDSVPQVWNAYPSVPNNVVAASWWWGDGSTSNSLYASHQYSVAGNYIICLSVTVSCGGTATYCDSQYVYRNSSNVVLVNVKPGSTVGLLKASQQNLQFNISPNPSHGLFELSLSGSQASPAKIEVLSLTGKKVYVSDAGAIGGTFKKEIDLSYLPQGIYFMTVVSDGQSTAKKIVIDK